MLSICHPGKRDWESQFLWLSPCGSTVEIQRHLPLCDLRGPPQKGYHPEGSASSFRFHASLECSEALAALEPAGAVLLAPPLGLIIYVSASGALGTWQGLRAVIGNILCLALAGLAFLPPTGAIERGSLARTVGLGSLNPGTCPRCAATELPRSCPGCLRALRLPAGRPNESHTARNQDVRKDAVAHFKTKPNY